VEKLWFIIRFFRNDEELPDYEPAEDKRRVESCVNEDIAQFNSFFQGLGNDPLSKFEVSAIKTYLAWKLGLAREKKDELPPSS